MRFATLCIAAAAIVTSLCIFSADAVSRLAHAGTPPEHRGATGPRAPEGKSDLSGATSERIVFAPVTVIGEAPRKEMHHR